MSMDITRLSESVLGASHKVHGSLLEAALGLAGDGIPVFPCNGLKQPFHKGGFHTATREPAGIRRAFSDPRAVLIGMPTGQASGYDALDLDLHKVDGAAAGWERQYASDLPATRVHGTMRGGRHYIFRHHPGVTCSASEFCSGVDVRGQGGYIIIPPSPGYRVEVSQPVAYWPAWLLRMLRPTPNSDRDAIAPSADIVRPASFQPVSSPRLEAYIRKVLDRIRAAEDGARHVTVLHGARAIGGIAGQAGLSDEDAIRRILEALRGRDGDPAKTARTALDGLTDGRKHPFTLGDRPYGEAR